jgi:ABC-type glycerol-3-phosphate transport system substrate-binding protein
MKKKKIFALALLTALSLTVSACGGADKAPASNGGSNQASSEKGDTKVKIKFFGMNMAYTSMEEMGAELQKKMPKYDIELLKVDTGTIDASIRTGVAGGNPADIYFYWPQNMGNLVKDGLALDLTPYLEANNGEWKNTFTPELLDLGKIDGKYYNVPFGSAYPVLIVNNEIFKQAGVEPKQEMTWQEFMDINEQIKTKTDAAPFAVSSEPDRQSWLIRQGVMSLANGDGKLEALAAGEVAADSGYYETALNNIQDLYKKNYWYPGEGALNITRDEINAAFLQGKVGMLAEVAGAALSISEQAEFDVTVVKWPAMGPETVLLGGANGYFIPANASNPDAAVEVLKTLLGSDIQSIHLAHGYPPANQTIKVENPVLQQIMTFTENLYPFEFHTKEAKMKSYYEGEMVPNFLMGAKIKDVLGQLDTLRQNAFK